jgi:hypothetical protein
MKRPATTDLHARAPSVEQRLFECGGLPHSMRAAEIRKALARAPIVATADPLPSAFSATLGRFLPLEETEGVALLLTMFVEIMSSFGLAAVTALYCA